MQWRIGQGTDSGIPRNMTHRRDMVSGILDLPFVRQVYLVLSDSLYAFKDSFADLNSSESTIGTVCFGQFGIQQTSFMYTYLAPFYFNYSIWRQQKCDHCLAVWTEVAEGSVIIWNCTTL